MGTLDARNRKATARPLTTFVGASGAVHEVPDPEFWPDEAQILFGDGGGAADTYRAIRLVVGDAAYDDFLATGGTGMMLMNHIQNDAGDSAGPVPLGESSSSEGLSMVPGAESSNQSSPESTA